MYEARWCSLACRRPEQLTFLLLHDLCLLQHLLSVALLTLRPIQVSPLFLSCFFLAAGKDIRRAVAAARNDAVLYIATHARSRGRPLERGARRIIISKRRWQFAASYLSSNFLNKFAYVHFTRSLQVFRCRLSEIGAIKTT